MNTKDLLTKPIAQIGPSERMHLALLLLADIDIAKAKINNDRGCMMFSEDAIKPGESRRIVVRNYATFKPTRLTILNQTREIREPTTIEFKSLFSRRTETRISTKLVSVPTNAWAISGMFVGQHNILPLAMGTPVPGAAFDHDCPFEQRTVHPGIDVEITVSHGLTTPADFRAVLFGIQLR